MKKSAESTIGALASINILPEYKNYRVPTPGSPVLVNTLVTLKAPPSTEQQRTAIDLIAVVDVSGSMDGQKISYVKQTLQYLLAVMNHPKDRLSIISFNNVAKLEAPLCPIEEGKLKLSGVIEGLRATGGTAIWSGMELGLKVLKEQKESSWKRLLGISERPGAKRLSSMFVLSDGQDNNHAPQKYKDLEAKLGDLDCPVFTFGYGGDHEPELLASIAGSRGTFTYISDISIVQDAMAAGLGAATSINMSAIKLNLTVPDGVKICQLSTPYQTETSANGRTATVSIPNLFADEGRDIFVELDVNSSNGEIIRVNGSYVDQNNARQFLGPVDCNVIFTDNEISGVKPNLSVTVARLRLAAAKASTEAVNAANGCDISGASEIVRTVLSSIVDLLVSFHGSNTLSEQVRWLRSDIKADAPSADYVKVQRSCFDKAILCFHANDAQYVESFKAIYADLESVHNSVSSRYSYSTGGHAYAVHFANQMQQQRAVTAAGTHTAMMYQNVSSRAYEMSSKASRLAKH
ncbi:hypothetical protein BJ742DRAFT_795723 [Cladochytrium replicatum]|nr:hypothetical protein BJ742DRAFT_795723 [Cladochytrium replicatum]